MQEQLNYERAWKELKKKAQLTLQQAEKNMLVKRRNHKPIEQEDKLREIIAITILQQINDIENNIKKENRFIN